MLDDLLGDFDFNAKGEDFVYETKEGWGEFVAADPEAPLPTTMSEYDSLGFADRALYNLARERYMTVGARISTPQLRCAAQAIRHAMADNRSPDSSKSGVVISGRAGLGKTTAVHEFGRAFERARRSRSDSSVRDLFPVAYASVPSHASGKSMVAQFAKFYGIPFSQTTRYDALLDRVTHVMRACSTELVIVDDIHRLDLHYRPNEQVADALKELSERCPGTLVYAGVDVARNGLFWGTRGEQIMSRFELVKFEPYSIDDPEGSAVWGSVLLDLESSLNLINQERGALKTVASELHHLSAGSIGRLAKSVRRAARRAIAERRERLDLDEVLAHLASQRDSEGWAEVEVRPPSPRPKPGRPVRRR